MEFFNAYAIYTTLFIKRLPIGKILVSQFSISFFIHNNVYFLQTKKIEPMTKAMPFNQKRKKSLLFFHKPSGRKDKVQPKHIGLPKNIHRYPLPQAPC